MFVPPTLTTQPPSPDRLSAIESAVRSAFASLTDEELHALTVEPYLLLRQQLEQQPATPHRTVMPSTTAAIEAELATVYSGDALDALRTLPDNSVDSVVTDPPYGLANLPAKKVADTIGRWVTGEREFIPAGRGFMGASWDKFVPPPALWDECLRVLKPGGYLVTFAGARTQDLMTLSVRLAGFTIKDTIAWARGDIFPKTKQSLTSGYEPIILAQKPLDGTVDANIEQWGTGGLDTDACRTRYVSEADEAESKGKNQHGKYGTQHGGNAIYGDFSGGGTRDDYNPPGRWPKNLLLSEHAANELDERFPTGVSGGKPKAGVSGDGSAGPARFFPRFDVEPSVFYAGRATVKERPVSDDGTKHTTVKPLSVMRWLVRLVTPEGGTVLDPFLGSGTTAEAALLEGRRVIGSEGHEPYIDLIRKRLERAAEGS